MNVLKRRAGVDYQGPVNNGDLAPDIKIGSLLNSPAPVASSGSVMDILNWLTSQYASVEVATSLDLVVEEVSGVPFEIVSNSSTYSRSGDRVSVALDVEFYFPDGDNLGKIVGLPYERVGSDFAVNGVVVTPLEHAPGYPTTNLVIVRPDVDDAAAVRVYQPDGWYYHPTDEEATSGNYRLIAEFFYYTNGSLLNAIYVQVFTSEEVYAQSFDSETVYYSTI